MISINERYVKQTYEALSRNDLNIENVVIQISQLPVREQHKFFRLLISYVDKLSDMANKPHWSTMNDIIKLSQKLIEVVNQHQMEEEYNGSKN